jgi:prefoldin subunit 5
MDTSGISQNKNPIQSNEVAPHDIAKEEALPAKNLYSQDKFIEHYENGPLPTAEFSNGDEGIVLAEPKTTPPATAALIDGGNSSSSKLIKDKEAEKELLYNELKNSSSAEKLVEYRKVVDELIDLQVMEEVRSERLKLSEELKLVDENNVSEREELRAKIAFLDEVISATPLKSDTDPAIRKYITQIEHSSTVYPMEQRYRDMMVDAGVSLTLTEPIKPEEIDAALEILENQKKKIDKEIQDLKEKKDLGTISDEEYQREIKYLSDKTICTHASTDMLENMLENLTQKEVEIAALKKEIQNFKGDSKSFEFLMLEGRLALKEKEKSAIVDAANLILSDNPPSLSDAKSSMANRVLSSHYIKAGFELSSTGKIPVTEALIGSLFSELYRLMRELFQEQMALQINTLLSVLQTVIGNIMTQFDAIDKGFEAQKAEIQSTKAQMELEVKKAQNQMIGAILGATFAVASIFTPFVSSQANSSAMQISAVSSGLGNALTGALDARATTDAIGTITGYKEESAQLNADKEKLEKLVEQVNSLTATLEKVSDAMGAAAKDITELLKTLNDAMKNIAK